MFEKVSGKVRPSILEGFLANQSGRSLKSRLSVDMLLKKIHTALAILLMAGPVCACHSQSIDWQNGAKRGWIVEIYQSDSQSEKLPECLQAIPESERMNRHFVKVQYRHVRLMRVAIAELPKELQAKIDDQVELWPEDCSRGKLSRISKLLSSNNQ